MIDTLLMVTALVVAVGAIIQARLVYLIGKEVKR